MMRCPLCGFEFDATAMSCHSSCAFNESCGIICCPNCGYQMADEQKSRLASVLRRLLEQRHAKAAALAPVRPLTELAAGEYGKVVAIQSANHARVERLNVLGLIPDAQIRLEQKRPTYVVRVGFTELSVEREIAQDILVDTAAEAGL
jgi:Fe2+ transport system protein FeoA